MRGRLAPPPLTAPLQARGDLLERVAAGFQGRLVAVTAAAGYGKTTLLAHALAASGRPWAWCSCDERLAEAPLFLRHLAAAVAERVAGFGRGLPLDAPPDEQVACFCNAALVGVPDDLVLVVDGVHHLGGASIETLGLLVEHLQPGVHVALASRTDLPFPLARLRIGGVLEVDEDDLAFSEAEAEGLLRGIGLAPSREQVADVHRRTEGWVTGLLLAASRRGPLRPKGPAPADPLAEYLSEEVFLPLPATLREALLDTCVLERLTPSLVEALTGRSDAEALLGALARRHVFTATEDGGASYRYREPFRAFLLRSLEGREPAPGELHRRAGAALAAAGDHPSAIDHYLGGGELRAAAAELELVAARMVSGPEAGRLAGWLARLPEEDGADGPDLVLARASLLAGDRSYEEACSTLEAAVGGFLGGGDHERAALALCRLIGAAELSGGRWDRTMELAHGVLATIPPETRFALDARVRLAVLHVPRGDQAGAERELGEAERAEAGASPGLRVWARLVRVFAVDHPAGRSEWALATMRECIDSLAQEPAHDPLARLAWAHAYRGLVLSDLGRHEEALEEAGRVEAAGARQGLGRAAAMWGTWLRLGALAGLGRWGDLDIELDRASPLVADGSSEVRAHRFHLAAAQRAARLGDAAAVAARVAEARPRLRRFGHAFEEALVLSDLALAASGVGLDQLARELAAEAREKAEVARAPLALARALLVVTAVNGAHEGQSDLLAEAPDVAGLLRFAVLTTERERRLAEGVLARAFVAMPDRAPAPAPPVAPAPENGGAGAPHGEARSPARRRRRRDDPAAVTGSAPPLRYQSLGAFTVWRGDRQVPGSAFVRQKARMLLAALLSADQLVHREALLEWLWPELPPERGMAALRTNLSALRHALDPELRRGGESSQVVAEGEAYRLIVRPDDRWDAADFLRAVREALRMDDAVARPRLEAAVDAYGGTFLPEWPYAEWSEPRRAELEQVYRDAMQHLAETLSRVGDLHAAIGRYRRLLGLEPERESWHRALMDIYARAGERGLALRQYHLCRQLLNEELGVEPSLETRALYTTLLH